MKELSMYASIQNVRKKKKIATIDMSEVSVRLPTVSTPFKLINTCVLFSLYFLFSHSLPRH